MSRSRDGYGRPIIGTVALLVLSAAGSSAREPFENQWGPFTGTITDEVTGQPIPGAVFVVMWFRHNWAPIAGAPDRFLDARIAVADEHGRFDIPRRSRPWNFWMVQTPGFESVAPGYAFHHDVGAQNAPMTVRLHRITPQERRRLWSDDPLLVMIPVDECSALETSINQRRQQLNLPAVGFCSGVLEDPPRPASAKPSN